MRRIALILLATGASAALAAVAGADEDTRTYRIEMYNACLLYTSPSPRDRS